MVRNDAIRKKDSYSKNRGGKTPNQQSGTYTIKTYRKPSVQLFSNRWHKNSTQRH